MLDSAKSETPNHCVASARGRMGEGDYVAAESEGSRELA
jgi:hypothetical protein